MKTAGCSVCHKPYEVQDDTFALIEKYGGGCCRECGAKIHLSPYCPACGRSMPPQIEAQGHSIWWQCEHCKCRIYQSTSKFKPWEEYNGPSPLKDLTLEI